MSSKPKVGDLVLFVTPPDEDEDGVEKLSYKLRTEPIEVLWDYKELNNPKIVNYSLDRTIPQDPGCWVIVKQKDLFNDRGYLIRMVKISNLQTGSSGWVSEKCVRFPDESDELHVNAPTEENK